MERRYRRLMEAIDPHRKRLEPLFDQIPLDIVKVAAQVTPREGSQAAHAVDEKRRFREVVFLGSWIGVTPF